MKSPALLGLFILAATTQGAAAQQDPLTDQQKVGRQVFAQSCGVCHLPPMLGAKTYGPPLNKDAGGGDDDTDESIDCPDWRRKADRQTNR